MERGSSATHFYVFLPAVLDKKGRMGYDLNNRENVSGHGRENGYVKEG